MEVEGLGAGKKQKYKDKEYKWKKRVEKRKNAEKTEKMRTAIFSLPHGCLDSPGVSDTRANLLKKIWGQSKGTDAFRKKALRLLN